MERKLIHIVESAARHPWFEELVIKIKNTQIHQSVITIEPKGEIFKVLENEKILITGGIETFTFLKLCRAAYSVKKIDRMGKPSLVLAQGHMPSISALISKLVLDIDYGIVHHQSPIIFFDSFSARHPFRGTVHKYLYKNYIRRAKFIQALSLEVSNSLVELGYPKNQIILLGHGIAMNSSKSSTNLALQKNRGADQEIKILMVGRLSWEKNYSLAFKVIAEIVKKCPGLKVKIAGTGPDLESLEEIRKELNLQENVELLGWEKNIEKLMFEADILLHLSLTESYGQVLLEACMCNLPVFTFPVGIALDLRKDHNPLIHILSSRNQEEISEEILSFLKNKENRLDSGTPQTLEHHTVDYIHGAMTAYLAHACKK